LSFCSLYARLLRLIPVLLLGATSVLGFAPFYLFPLPVITLAVLFWLWRRSDRPIIAALHGYVFGLGFFGAGVSWIYISLHDFGEMSAPLAALATALMCAILALFPALAGSLQGYGKRAPAINAVLLMPALWVLLEWMRGWVFTGFPWAALGYSQVPVSPLAGFAPLLGVYGVSLVAAVSAGMLMLLVATRALRWAPLVALLWLAGWGLQQVQWTQPTGAPVSVSLLQGNIHQDLKWQQGSQEQSLNTYQQLVLSSRSRLIILPETALPMFSHEVPPSYLQMLEGHARKLGGDVIVGIPEYRGSSIYYNSAFSFGSAPQQTYRKFHLVPFGEYLPLRPLFAWVLEVLHIPLGDFSRGAPVQQPLQVAGQRVAVDICYEDVFGEEVITQLPAATMLVNLSNDAWFGHSIGPEQHLQIAQMRALETGRTMLRATNTGVTAIIDQRGRVVKRAPEFEVFALNGTAQGYSGSTPFVRFGNYAALGLLATMLAVAGILIWRVRRP